ncbi:hypothetical protein [Leifsonia poae]|uniref:hypothetical protein n=1 Tax=Leifsonia poae TaxID=110933 RepID=UPI001CBBB7A5|nr:hypothetical protein [Leifsonia poae]
MTSDDHPELAGYEPMQSPLHGPRRMIAMRVVVVLGLVALILPGVLVTVSIAATTAGNTCAVYVAHYAPNANSSSATFDLFGPAGPGWQCYALNTEGDSTFVAPLGLIPSTPHRL